MSIVARPHALRFRQVHLDFHTSGEIPDVGAQFDAESFKEALRRGHVDSVTLFSKCHHGWSYHPTQVGRMHPTLRRDLLGEQIAACREIGVRCPIYLSAGFDELMAFEHPEWLVKDINGVTSKPLDAGTFNFKSLRFDSPYLDYLCAQIEEVVRRWPDNDGIFLDIVSARSDYHPATLAAMRAAGLDPQSPSDVAAHGQAVLKNYYERTTAAVKSVRADTPVFHNGGHIPVGAHSFNFFNTHFELESLPTGGWGYDHFPFSARYALTQPRDFLGMTGKFHIVWGEFGGFKRPAALRYECSAMLAQGAKCSIGDQLHPDGRMNADTYALIGAAYSEVAAKEPWCREARAAARIALVCSETDQSMARGVSAATKADEGAARMLLELHLPFVVLDEAASWNDYEIVVLPDGTRLTRAAAQKARAFLHAGGRIVAAGSALLDEAGEAFALDPGATFAGRSTFDPDYLVANALSAAVPVRSAIVIEGGACKISLTTGRVLAERREPYFQRSFDRFCSHQHTPDSPAVVSPAAVLGNGIAYFAHNLFAQYRGTGQPLYRDFFLAALGQLCPDGLPVVTNLPTGGRFNLLEQATEHRFVAHLLYAPISLRAHKTFWGRENPVEIIEELIPLRDTRVSLRLPRAVTRVSLVPDGRALDFAYKGDKLEFCVPEFTGHQMVALSYAAD
jgi:hypothetical protein